MSKYTKEEREHVRKDVYGFSIYNPTGEGFTFYFTDYVIDFTNTDAELKELFRIIYPLDYIDQYYICKKFATLKGLQFKEYDEKEWKNVSEMPSPPH